MSFKETELGKIPSEWEIKTLEDIANVVGGGTPKTSTMEFWDGDISWITPKDLSNYQSKYISKGERSITKAGMNNSSTKLLPKGTILFSSRAPIGYVAIAEKEVCTNQGFKSLVCKDGISYNEFVYYLMKINSEKLEQIAGGSTFKEVSGKIVREFKVMTPPIKEQKVIANILSSLDKKIEVINQINKTLEAMAQELFKHWFVDFEFPNENGEPYKSSGGEMEESEHGMIPKGWEVGKFIDYIDTILGGDWGKESLQGNYNKEVYCLRGADIPEVRIGRKGNLPKRYILEKNYVNKKLSSGDLVVEISGGSPNQSTGRITYITDEMTNKYDADIVCTNFCRAITLINKNLMEYFYFYWQQLYEQNIFFQYENGTTGIKNFDINTFIENFSIVKPQENIIVKFSEVVGSIIEKIQINGDENIKLSEIRDTLLPKLMSGEIRVPIDEEN